MHAGLAAAQACLVGNVVVDKGSRVEMLDCRRCGKCLTDIAAHCRTCRHANKRTMALAAVFAVLGKRSVQVLVHIGMATRRNERVDNGADLARIAVQVRLEQSRRARLDRSVFRFAVSLEILDVFHDLGILHVRCDVSHLQRFPLDAFYATPWHTPRPINSELVGAVGLEPTNPKVADFKSAVYANSTTLPWYP